MSAVAARGSATRVLIGNGVALALLVVGAFAFLPLHDDSWWTAMPRPRQWWLAAASAMAYVAFVACTAWRAPPGKAGHSVSSGDDATLLVVHASQTGYASELAERTASSLRDAGLPCMLRSLSDIDSAALAQCRRALFIASTTGEGNPPDPALAFVADAMTRQPDLGHLRYAVLALGDREYTQFCGFGHQLDQWLRRCGANALFDLTEVDNGDPGALRHWQHHLGLLGGATELPDWSVPRYDAWILRERQCLNPGSVGGAVYRIALQPPVGTTSSWQAGDLVEIGPCNPPAAVEAMLANLRFAADAIVEADGTTVPLKALLSRSRLPTGDAAAGSQSPQALADNLQRLPHREYSIASLPAEGTLQLLVRRMTRPDGTAGHGSGWLCQHAGIGTSIAARLRSNPNFHGPPRGCPMVLVGNGTGIAGLRAHLAARVATGETRNWLLFGERNADRDDFCRDDLMRWQGDGMIERIDLVFSRDGGPHRYVQDALRDASDTLRRWHAEGCVVYVCGSLQGMAPAVDAVLREALGDTEVESMLANGRYRRDVY